MRIKIIGAVFLALAVAVACGCALSATAQPVPVVDVISIITPTANAATPVPTIRPTPIIQPASAADPIKALIAGMSAKELIGQMVMIGFSGTADMSEQAKQMMQEYYIGNIIFFGQNVTRFAQAKNLIAAVRRQNANARIPLNICIDIEGGDVTRFRGQWKPFIKSAASLGKLNDPTRVYSQYTQIGATLKDMGFTLDLAPVADIAPKPSATFLRARMFGSDPDAVAPLIAEAVKGLHNGGVASLVKHFPGHGETSVDSHRTLPVLDASREALNRYALIPFKAAIEAGVDAVLVAHLKFPKIDDEITSVSRVVITDILRKQLGFTGVVLSDDMRMAGVSRTYTAGEAAVRFIEAGGDIVLIGKQVDKQQDVLSSLNAAYLSGRLPRERLEESVERVLHLKRKWCALAL